MSTRLNECGYCGKDHGSSEPCEALDSRATVAGLTYWAGLQDDEVSASLGCGCVLHSEGAQLEPNACDIAFFACPTHEHADELRQEVEYLLTWFEQTKDVNNLAGIHSCGLDRFRTILAKMQSRRHS